MLSGMSQIPTCAGGRWMGSAVQWKTSPNAAAMSFVFVFSLFYFWDSNTINSSSLILSNSSTIEDEGSINNEVADLDSLEEYLDTNK